MSNQQQRYYFANLILYLQLDSDNNTLLQIMLLDLKNEQIIFPSGLLVESGSLYKIYCLQNRSMSWFCKGSLPKQTKDVIVQYDAIPDKAIATAYPKTVEDINTAQSMSPNQRKNVQDQLVRTQPNKEMEIKENAQNYQGIFSSSNDKVMKKLQKSNYAELVEQYRGTNKMWTDPNFTFEKDQYVAGWKRIHEIIPNCTFMANQITPNAIIQGKLQNCYFLSAIASLSERQYRIKNLFNSTEINPNGIYMCKLLFNGIYQQVIVDDQFPVDQKGNLTYAKPYKGTDIWVMVLEKCWAKMFGKYKKVNFGFNQQALNALSGAPVIVQILSYAVIKKKSDMIYEIFKQNYKQNHILTAGTVGASKLPQQAANILGLHASHSYSILGVFDILDKKAIMLRNPWGESEWTKKLWDNDPLWQKLTPKQKQQINFKYNSNNNDGVFYMLWQDFMCYYDTAAICLIDDNSNYFYKTYTFKNNHPQYYNLYTDPHKDEQLFLTFSQNLQYHFKQFEKIQYSNITVIVTKMGFDQNNQRTYQYVGSYAYYSKQWSNNFHLPLSNFPEGRYTFRIVVNSKTFDQTELTLGMYSAISFGGKRLLDVDDLEFVQRSFLSRAQNTLQARKYISQEDDVWVSQEFIGASNLGYVLLHVSKKAKSNFTLTFKQKQNKQLLFFGVYAKDKELTELVERGTQKIFVYSYMTPCIASEYVDVVKDGRRRPEPLIAMAK